MGGCLGSSLSLLSGFLSYHSLENKRKRQSTPEHLRQCVASEGARQWEGGGPGARPTSATTDPPTSPASLLLTLTEIGWLLLIMTIMVTTGTYCTLTKGQTLLSTFLLSHLVLPRIGRRS